MKAVLLPNMVEFPAVSMKRYADELLTALRDLAPPEWTFEELVCNRSRRVEKLLPGKQGEAWASRAGRFIKYPRMAARAVGDVYHVLDHSHANLVDALPVSRTILTCHDIIPYLAATGRIPIPAGRLTRYTFPLLRIRAMKRCRFVLADSEATRQDLLTYGKLSPEQVVTVYLGVNSVFVAPPAEDLPGIRARVRARHSLSEEARIVFQVGTATRYKNTPTILRALRHLIADGRRGADTYLVRVGAPFFDDEEALIDELGVRERIVFVGRVKEDKDLAEYYQAADVFVFPSIWEGFGLPPLEAMACGTPPVTSNVSSLPEVVGDAGLTVPPMDHEALAGALHSVLSDGNQRSVLRQRCLDRATLFTWRLCAQNTLDVYRRVAQESERR